MHRKTFLQGLSALLLAGAGAAPSLAADPFPSRPVKIVVPFPPGGATDVAARLLGERMSPLLGQPVLIDNRPGGQTVIGAEFVARAAPDGHTILMASGTTLTLNPLLPERLPYKPEDFAPIVLVTKYPFGVVARAGLPTDIAGFVAMAKSRNGQLNYGSNGPTSFNNIAAVVVAEGLGIKMQDVTYRGDAQQLNDLLAGTLDLIVVAPTSALTAHRSGKAHIIGWTGEERLASMPDIPNFSEVGPNMVAQSWFGLLAPAKTPPDAVARINAAAVRALQAPELRERFLAEGQFVGAGSPEDFTAFMSREIDRWRPLVRRLSGAARPLLP